MEKTDYMIIVPHQDDETMMAGGILHRAVNEGKTVKVVIATNGDYLQSTYDYGRKRIKECIEAVSLLGVHKRDILFMGYGDTGFEKEVSFLYRLYHEQDCEKVIPSSCSQITYGLPHVKDEYHFKKWNKHAKYNRANFINDLYTILLENAPQRIYTTSQYDTHGDHVGLYCFVIEALKRIREKSNDYHPEVYEGIVHSPAGDDQWPIIHEDTTPLRRYSMPYNLEETTPLLWNERISYEIPQDMVGSTKKDSLKYKAMLQYKTQLKEEVRDYLLSFVMKDEIFWKVDI